MDVSEWYAYVYGYVYVSARARARACVLVHKNADVVIVDVIALTSSPCARMRQTIHSRDAPECSPECARTFVRLHLNVRAMRSHGRAMRLNIHLHAPGCPHEGTRTFSRLHPNVCALPRMPARMLQNVRSDVSERSPERARARQNALTMILNVRATRPNAQRAAPERSRDAPERTCDATE